MSLSILWLTRRRPYPPAQGGDFIYSRHMIESTARGGANVTVLCAVGDGSELQDDNGIIWRSARAEEKSALLSVFSRLPNRCARFHNAAFADLLRRTLAEHTWDAVVFDYLSLLAYRDIVEALPVWQRPATLYLAHNHEASTGRSVATNFRGSLIKKLALLADAAKIARLERAAVAALDMTGPNTEEDEALFRSENPQARYVVLKPGYDGPKAGPRDAARLGRVVIVLGSYQWVAKRQNLEELLAAGSSCFPGSGVELRVVGFMDESYRAMLQAMHPWARIVGAVDSVEQELAQARIGIVAERTGGGFKHKVLNYVFGRVTVLGLAEAMAGFPLTPGESYIAAADISDLCHAAIANIDADDRLAALSARAFTACEHAFDWDDRGRKLVAALGPVASPADSAIGPQRG